VSQCRTIEQLSLLVRAVELCDIVNNTFIAEDRDMTLMFIPEDAVDITIELDEITNISKPLLPNDVSSSAEVLDIMQSYVVNFNILNESLVYSQNATIIYQ